MDGDRWTWVEATEYFTATDPRVEIRQFADDLAAPPLAGVAMAAYAVEFATSIRSVVSSVSTAYGDYADYASADCLGYGFSPWASPGLSPVSWFSPRGPGLSPYSYLWGLVPLSTTWGSPAASFGLAYAYSGFGYDPIWGCRYGPVYYTARSAPPRLSPPIALVPPKTDSSHLRQLAPRDSTQSRATPTKP